MSLSIKAREGDFIETIEGLIFDVKGLIHPPEKVIAYLRYFEDPLGDRVRNGKKYRKVYSLSDRDNILRKRNPQYIYYDHIFGEWMEGVPKSSIIKHYKPEEKVLNLLESASLDPIEGKALRFVQTIHDFSGISMGGLGISGSILVDLHNIESDIDVIVYGKGNCISVYEDLKFLMQNGEKGFSKYDINDLRKLYDFRFKDTWIPFEEFYKTEHRKVSQGKFLDRDFFVRFILDWNEINENYGDYIYKNIGYMRVKAKIEDDENAIFTPCKYVISEVKILDGDRNITPPKEIVSFRGRFCEQAKKNEYVIAQGKLEKVISKNGDEYHRIVLGGKPSDFMIIEEE
ncbi:MAG: hypothetical protein QXI93_01700 [Candidatus Methanomethylicia archaeon]